MTRIAPALATTVALGAFLALGLASPAHAETGVLPSTDTIFAVDCEDSIGQLWSVNPLDAVFTPVGTGSDHPLVNCAGPSAFNLVDGLGYWISWDGEDALFSVDPVTGDSTFIGLFVDSETGDRVYASSIAIGADGSAYLLGGDTNYGNTLYSLDLTSGEATAHGDITGDDDLWSFAYNPADGGYYAFDANGGGFYSVDVTAVTSTLLVDAADVPIDIFGIAFDSTGNLWGFGEGEATEGEWVLFSTTVANFVDDLAIVGITVEGEQETFSESLFITYDVPAPAPVPVPAPAPAPVLAATGSELPLVGGGAAALLLMAGAAAVIAARRRNA